MSNKKISQLSYNTNPTLEDLMPIVNSGETKQISVRDLADIVNPYDIADLGFIIRPNSIDRDILLPENSNVLYFDVLNMGTGTLTVPSSTTLTIATSTPTP